MALVAASAAMFWAWSTFFDPTGRLIRQLGADQPAYIRREAAISLGYGVSPGRVEQAVSALIVALKDPSPRVRESALAGLFGHKNQASRAVPEVIPLLKDADGGVRYSASAVLGTIAHATGPERSKAIPALLGVLGDVRSDVREAAASSLLELGEVEGAIVGLSGLVRDPDPRVRLHVLDIISKRAGPSDRAVVPVLLAAAKDEDPGNRLAAAARLIRYGLSEVATPILDECEKAGDRPFRDRAGQIRAMMAPADTLAGKESGPP